jgi:ABC-type Fe3+/spermidine/putrescine transport system ATPase subunit
VVATEVGDVAVARENIPTGSEAVGSEVVLMARPEALRVTSARPDASNATVWPGKLRAEMFRGAHTDMFVEVGSHIVRARADDETGLRVGDSVFVTGLPQRIRALPATEVASATIDEQTEMVAIEAALTREAAASPRTIAKAHE